VGGGRSVLFGPRIERDARLSALVARSPPARSQIESSVVLRRPELAEVLTISDQQLNTTYQFFGSDFCVVEVGPHCTEN